MRRPRVRSSVSAARWVALVAVAVHVDPSSVLWAQTANALPAPPGVLVDIGGQRVHLVCTGRGSPTVVFENGAGDFASVWSLVQPSVSRFTRACSYDRAGYAWSDPGARPRTYDQLALELHTALERAGERPPYVLVGQSYGGLVTRGYARRYPRDVVGMVLVDAAHEDQRVSMGGGRLARIRDAAVGRMAPIPRIAADSALLARRNSAPPPLRDARPLDPPLDRLPRSAQYAWRLAESDTVYRLVVAAEMDWSPEELARMHRERERDRATLGDLPLVVIARAPDPSDPRAEERVSLQRDLAALSRRSTLRVATHAGHNVHLEEPELVIDAIRGSDSSFIVRPHRRVDRSTR